MKMTPEYTALSLPLLLTALRAIFVRGIKNIYLHIMSYFHIDMTQVVDIFTQVRQEFTYST